MDKRLKELFLQRFNKGSTEECWEWKGNLQTGKFRYGRILYKKKTYLAHRLSAQIYIGNIEGLVVCHKCDNPSCVNPNHLFLGTKGDNNRDRENKGRGVRKKGEEHPGSKLTKNDVDEILRTYNSDAYTYKDIGNIYGVSPSTIGNIIRGEKWDLPTNNGVGSGKYKKKDTKRGNQKLTWDIVQSIRTLTEINKEEICKKYNISRSCLNRILNNSTWKNS